MSNGRPCSITPIWNGHPEQIFFALEVISEGGFLLVTSLQFSVLRFLLDKKLLGMHSACNDSYSINKLFWSLKYGLDVPAIVAQNKTAVILNDKRIVIPTLQYMATVLATPHTIWPHHPLDVSHKQVWRSILCTCPHLSWGRSNRLLAGETPSEGIGSRNRYQCRLASQEGEWPLAEATC